MKTEYILQVQWGYSSVWRDDAAFSDWDLESATEHLERWRRKVNKWNTTPKPRIRLIKRVTTEEILNDT